MLLKRSLFNVIWDALWAQETQKKCLSCHGFTWRVCERVRQRKRARGTNMYKMYFLHSRVDETAVNFKVGQNHNHLLCQNFLPAESKTYFGLFSICPNKEACVSTASQRQFTQSKFSHCRCLAYFLHDNGVLVPLKPQPQPSFWLCKLASRVPVNMVMTLMLMLVQVNAFCSSHYQTLI